MLFTADEVERVADNWACVGGAVHEVFIKGKVLRVAGGPMRIRGALAALARAAATGGR